MQPFVTIITVAYNAQQYIRETIESVLRQDEPNWEYVLRDNGSTDDTYAIMQEYAQKDSRIRVLRNEVNYRNDDGTYLELSDYCPAPRGEYFAHLDADDILKEDFVSKLYHYGKQQDADIVIAGTRMFADGSGHILTTRLPMSFVFREGSKLLPNDFIESYGSLRPMWGKLYKTKFYFEHITAIQRERERFGVINGGDTIYSLGYLFRAKCVVSVSEFYHYYRVKTQGLYRTTNPEVTRIDEGRALFWQAVRILPALKIDVQHVKNFLYYVFLAHVNDLIKMIDGSNRECSEQLYHFFEKILNDSLLEMISQEMYAEWQKLIELPMINILSNALLPYKGLEDNPVQYFAVYFTKKVNIPQSIKVLYLLLGIYHPQNQYYYGLNYLAQEKCNHWSWLTDMEGKTVISCKALIYTPVLLVNWIKERINDSSSLKVEMLSKWDEGKIEEAYTLVVRILENNPVDIEGIYFGIAIAHSLKKQDVLMILLDVSRKFYPVHEELNELIEQISQ